MLIDLYSAAPDKLEADVAIIGAGAAGITIARRLVASGKSVILLESGGLDYEAETAALNAGANAGEDYYDLEDARLRFFGGTTAIWGGRSAELDPIDFETRSWVPFSGWPFPASELRPWYDAAYRLLGLRSLETGTVPAKFPDLQDLAVRYWLFDRKFDRFGFAANRDLVENTKTTAVIHATVREIVASESGQAVDLLDVRSIRGRRLTVRARTYVLAAGGLENPRILLASNSVRPAGLGNDHDLVGRFFMEHPHARGGRIVGAPAWLVLDRFGMRRHDGFRYAPLLTPSPKLQREAGILNSALTVAARPPPHGRNTLVQNIYMRARHSLAPNRQGRSLWRWQRRIARGLKDLAGPVVPWSRVVRGRDELALVIRAEQSPNPDSRVTLDRETDATGMPRIRLDWRLQELDVASVSTLVDALGREAGNLGLGRVEKAQWLREGSRNWVTDPLISAHPIGGYHHMGTTRMADDPKRGVTDGWGKVHGLANLYVAGSSLFPTAGWANPTLTILALALRTAERLADGE